MRPAHTESVEGSSRFGGFARRLHGVGPLLGLVALCIGGTLLNPDFATFDNAMNVLTRTSFIGIIAVGMTFVIISGGIDLSVGSMAALIAGSMIWIMNALAHGMGGFTFAPLAIIAIGIVLALVLGGLFGLALWPRVLRESLRHTCAYLGVPHRRGGRCGRVESHGVRAACAGHRLE